jgi:hypothetical protein
MHCRYAHRRIAALLTQVQSNTSATVIDWPQLSVHSATEKRAEPDTSQDPTSKDREPESH